MAEGSFGEALAELAHAGGDTDTIASIAGQIAGARLGKERLPSQLLDTLPERALISEAAEKFQVFLETGTDT